jgi:adenylyl- and sulfurtransferase ThiI
MTPVSSAGSITEEITPAASPVSGYLCIRTGVCCRYVARCELPEESQMKKKKNQSLINEAS